MLRRLASLPVLSAVTRTASLETLPPISGWTQTAPHNHRRSRRIWGVFLAGGVALFATWLGTRTLPWFGPMLADTLRALVGSQNVTRLEEVVAGVEDGVRRTVSNGSARSLSDSTPEELVIVPPPSLPEPEKTRAPLDVSPLYPEVASGEDGVWQGVFTKGAATPVLHRTILHPDPERKFAELFVFALDLSRVDVHAVPGSIEPKSPKFKPGLDRPGIIPAAHHDRLIAAFNGGFKAEHGKYGMKVGEREFLAPRPHSCTFGVLNDGSLRIATWKHLAPEADTLSWWRQTPPCMVEDGVLHPGLRVKDSKNWGATLEGETVIRRSAVGLSADGKRLFVGISNSTTARALADGMQHAGAVHVAQLDVNFSYPRFLLYRHEAGKAPEAFGAVKGLLYSDDQYVGRSSSRDFFYVTLKDQSAAGS